MKKKIPKFDQKTWDEKQAKVAEEANGGSPLFPYLNNPVVPIPGAVGRHVGNGTLYTASQNRAGKTQAYIDLMNQYGINPKVFIGDPFDKYLFGGEDGERDYKLPQGVGQYTYGDWVNGSDPAFKQEEKCCKPEDRVNISFMMDKWACKVCGKDME